MSISHKSTLAKLLATENLRIEHQKVPTAMFDLKNRTLILPTWKDMSTDLYDLLIGHEVGHALFTPAQGWHGEIDARGMGIKSYLNVLEDTRIERKIKDKFPGIRKNFFAGYQELFDNNFFGVKGYDLNKLRLIDRINLHYKVGSLLAAPFSDDERKYLARVDALETWDDVTALAVELYELAKSEPEYDFDSSTFMGEMMDTSDDGEPEINDEWVSEMDSDQSTGDSEQSDSAVDKPTDDTDAGKPNTGDDSGEEDADAGKPNTGVKLPGSNDVPVLNDDPMSITDQMFREKEEEFIDSKSRPYAYGILRKVDLKDYVIPMDWVVDNMRPLVYSDRWLTIPIDYDTTANEVYSDFRSKNQKYINLMVQEFEMRRRASQFARAQVAKTGRLDVDRVWAHKISEDLFARNTVVPDGKNHGMLLFLDMSGSMSSNMRGTIEQLVTLMMFCRKVRIPFEVYGFTNNRLVNESFPLGNEMRERRDAAAKASDKELVIDDNSFNLLQFLSDNCSSSKFNEVVRNLLMCGMAYDHRLRRKNEEKFFRNCNLMSLASTPLEESIMVARSIADKFRAKNRVEVLNTIFLTDGDGDGNISITGSRYGANHVNITDSTTGAVTTVKYDDNYSYQMQTALLNLYQKATGSRTINFFIASYAGAHAKWTAKRMHNSAADFDTKWKEEWKQKYFHTKNSFGFNDRFLIPGGEDLSIEEDVLESEDNSPKKLRQAFKKFQNKKQTNRVLLNKMIQAVA